MNTRRDAGFALPVAIFALVVLGVLVTGGFYMARQESRIGSASEFGSRAFYLAEKGLNEVFEDYDASDFRAISLLGVDTVTGSEDEGDWTVEIFRASQKMVFLDATGTITEGGAVLQGASRRVGAIARLYYADIENLAALTTRGQTQVSGTADIYGNDSIPSEWSGLCSDYPQSDKPGIVTNDSSEISGQGASSVSGDPQAIQEDTTVNDSTFTVFGNITYDDLVAMAQWTRPGDASSTVSAARVTLNGDGTCNTGDPSNWGDPENPGDPCGSWFPITHFDGNGSISGDYGQGIILVDGDLRIQGNFVFYGLIIVQGTLDLRGTGQGIKIFGGIMASNADLESQSVTGGSSIHNSTCAIKRAIEHNGGTARARPILLRSWVDLSSVSSAQ